MSQQWPVICSCLAAESNKTKNRGLAVKGGLSYFPLPLQSTGSINGLPSRVTPQHFLFRCHQSVGDIAKVAVTGCHSWATVTISVSLSNSQTQALSVLPPTMRQHVTIKNRIC